MSAAGLPTRRKMLSATSLRGYEPIVNTIAEVAEWTRLKLLARLLGLRKSAGVVVDGEAPA